MRLMILHNRRLRTTMRADHGVLSIGSSPECGVHLPDPKISAHQASLAQDEKGAWWLEVLDTSMPTSLNRAVQKSRAKLRHADEIKLGAFAIRFFLESDRSRDELKRERLTALSKRHGESLPLGTVIQKFENEMSVSKEHLEQMTLLALRLETAESMNDLMTPLLRSAIRTFDAARAWIGIRRTEHSDFEWSQGMNSAGKPCERPPYSEKMQSRCLVHTQYLCVPESPAKGVRSAMAVPLACTPGNLGLLYVENDPDSEEYGQASLQALSAMACCVARPVENVLRQMTAKRRVTVSAEHSVARATQDAVTPKALPQWDDLLAAVYRRAGSARCSDFYDIMQLRDKTAFILVARPEVQGELLSRYFAELRATFRTSALYSEPPHLFARAINWIVFEGRERHTIDLACVTVNPTTGKVHYCLAGTGIGAGKIHADGTCEPVVDKPGPPVGQVRAPELASHSLDLASGDTLALATEGINSITNAEGEVFGRDGLKDNICDALGDTPSHVLSELESDLDDFVEGGDCPDDLTVVLLQRR